MQILNKGLSFQSFLVNSIVNEITAFFLLVKHIHRFLRCWGTQSTRIGQFSKQKVTTTTNVNEIGGETKIGWIFFCTRADGSVIHRKIWGASGSRVWCRMTNDRSAKERRKMSLSERMVCNNTSARRRERLRKCKVTHHPSYLICAS